MIFFSSKINSSVFLNEFILFLFKIGINFNSFSINIIGYSIFFFVLVQIHLYDKR